MSNAAIFWAYQQQAGGPAPKGVLLVLADLADEQHSCWPSAELIAERVEISERSVRRHIDELTARGLVRRERRYAGYGRRMNDRFILAVDGLFETPDPLEANLAGNESESEKPLVSTLEANLAGNESAAAPLEANCGRYIETPQGLDWINNPSIQSSPELDAGANATDTPLEPDPVVDTAEVDRELAAIDPRLSVASLEREVAGRIDVQELDLVAAAKHIIAASKQPSGIAWPPAYVAKSLVANPDRWRRGQTPLKPQQPVPAPSERDRRRDAEDAARAACARGEHDWGPVTWPEFDRNHCVRDHCLTPRRQVDAHFAELEARDFERSR